MSENVNCYSFLQMDVSGKKKWVVKPGIKVSCAPDTGESCILLGLSEYRYVKLHRQEFDPAPVELTVASISTIPGRDGTGFHLVRRRVSSKVLLFVRALRIETRVRTVEAGRDVDYREVLLEMEEGDVVTVAVPARCTLECRNGHIIPSRE